jgi:hypothetical protein
MKKIKMIKIKKRKNNFINNLYLILSCKEFTGHIINLFNILLIVYIIIIYHLNIKFYLNKKYD